MKVELFEFDPHSHASIRCEIVESGESFKVEYRVSESAIWHLPEGSELQDLAEGLWESSCFEAFEFDPQSDRYHEWNFSPDGYWFSKAFSSYREEQSPAEVNRPLSFEGKAEAGEFSARAEFPKLFAGESSLQLAVILRTEANGKLYYFAERHPGHKPDFHLRLL